MKFINRKSYKTRPFITGVARIIDLNGEASAYDRILPTDAYEALRSDWEAVGNDIRTSINRFQVKPVD